MKIIDKNGEVVVNPDLKLGRLEQDRILVAHHPAQPEVQEQSHTEVTKTYPNGGKDLRRVVDVAFTPAKEAWDEYEDVLRYIPYTPQELEQMQKYVAPDERLAALEAAMMELAGMLAEGQVV